MAPGYAGGGGATKSRHCRVHVIAPSKNTSSLPIVGAMLPVTPVLPDIQAASALDTTSPSVTDKPLDHGVSPEMNCRLLRFNLAVNDAA